MKNRKVTLAELNALKPCKPAESFLGKDWDGTLLDILKDTRVRDQDKIWAVTKLIDEKTARLFAVYCAREAVKNIKGEVDPRITNCIDVAERFANGQATDEERSAAYSASYSAAWSAYAAHSNSYSASRYASIYAVEYAAHSYSAAESAAYSAAATDASYAAHSYSAAESAAHVAAAATGAAWSAAYESFVNKLIAMISPNKPSRFVRTNVKLGTRTLYMKVGG